MGTLEGFVRVLRSEDLVAGDGLTSQIRAVSVGDETVLVGRLLRGDVVAFGAFCPHEMTDLREASFFDGKVRCLKHNYMYDPCTGENVVPKQISSPDNLWKLRPGYLPTYRAEEQDGWIWVSETPNPPPASWDPAEEERPAGARRARPGARATASASPGRPAPPAAVEQPPKRLRVQAGKEFQLRLPTTPEPGYTWRVEVSSKILGVVEERFDPTVPPRHQVRIVARGAGEATVRCSYGRPWDAEPAEIRTYVVMVEEQ